MSAQQIYNWSRQFTRLSDKQFNSAEGVDYSKQESEETRKLRRQNKKLKEELEFLKKAALSSTTLMCRVLGVSRSGYYRWLERPISTREARRMEMEALIKETYEAFEAMYGAPRLAKELTDLGHPFSVNYVAKIMSEQGIWALNGKGFNYSRHSLTMHNVSDNLLWRDFAAGRPNEKWTTDITYIWVKDRWLYLATVTDLYSRRIVGWSLDNSMTEALISKAMGMDGIEPANHRARLDSSFRSWDTVSFTDIY